MTNRRTFLKSAGLAGAASFALPQIVSSRVFGANDRLTLAHIGVGGMGGFHLREMVKRKDSGTINIAAVCEADEKRLAKAMQTAGTRVEPYRDYRYVLQRKDVDAVIIATPDHWHAVQMIHAAESGKHVYVEKPACCTIEEGKAMIAAAKRNKITVQVGSQGRSQPAAYAAHLYISNGMLGKVKKVTCWHYASPADTNPVPDSAPPPDLDWDLWLGPLPWRPYNARYCPGTFRWVMESGGGQIRDRGAHVMSNAIYFMEADHTGPVTIETTGTVPASGLWDTAMEMEVTYQFKNPDWTLVWSQPGQPVPVPETDPKKKTDNSKTYGAVYHGEKDSLVVWFGDGKVLTEQKALDFKKPPGGVDVYKSPGHHDDWFNGIKTGKKTIMNIDAAVATANLTILGNLSLLLGRKLQWDAKKGEIIGDEEARRMMSRPQRYPYVI